MNYTQLTIAAPRKQSSNHQHDSFYPNGTMGPLGLICSKQSKQIGIQQIGIQSSTTNQGPYANAQNTPGS